MSSNFNCSYMAMSSLTYISGFSVKFFFQPIYADYANQAYFDKRSHLNLLLLGWSFSILCPTAPLSIQSGCCYQKQKFLQLSISALLQIKMNSNFNCSYMAMSSLTNILGFSVRFFQPVYSVQEYYEIKITSKSFAQKFELK